MEEVVMSIAIGLGVGIGLSIYYLRKKRADAPQKEKILAMLAKNAGLTLPEIVTGLGLKDSFINRGKVMAITNPLVASGELVQEEPPGTTAKNRLSVLRFSLKK